MENQHEGVLPGDLEGSSHFKEAYGGVGGGGGPSGEIPRLFPSRCLKRCRLMYEGGSGQLSPLA